MRSIMKDHEKLASEKEKQTFEMRTLELNKQAELALEREKKMRQARNVLLEHQLREIKFGKQNLGDETAAAAPSLISE